MSPKTLLVPLLVAVLTATASVASVASVAEVRGAPAPSLEASDARAGGGPPAVEALRSWDSQRAEAWAAGDVAALASLYTPASVAGRRDVAMLRAWTARGLVVRDLRTQLLAVDVLAHTRSTWTLRVTDRLVSGVAVGPDVRRPLPRDEPTTRTVRLRLVDGAWCVASARQPGR